MSIKKQRRHSVFGILGISYGWTTHGPIDMRYPRDAPAITNGRCIPDPSILLPGKISYINFCYIPPKNDINISY